MVHDPAYLDTLDASTGKGLPSFDVTRFQEYHKHASHHPSPLRPIQVCVGRGEKGGRCWGVYHRHWFDSPGLQLHRGPSRWGDGAGHWLDSPELQLHRRQMYEECAALMQVSV